MQQGSTAVSTPAPPRQLVDWLAYAVSLICSPPMLIIPLALLAGGAGGPASSILTLVVVTGLLPIVFVYLAYRAGYVSNLDLTNRAERLQPALFTLLCAVATYAILRGQGAPALMLDLAVGLICQLALLAVTTCCWKISYHAGTASALALLALSVRGPALGLPLLVLAGLVGWSRIRLGRHTPAQVGLGLMSAAPIFWWTRSP